jgi:uncharacterized membrane protein YhiD involved in acid resistance
VILRDSKSRTVEGLTTAASVWVTAAVGIACGLGAWSVVAIAATIALVLLLLGGRLEALYDLKEKTLASDDRPHDTASLGGVRKAEDAKTSGSGRTV